MCILQRFRCTLDWLSYSCIPAAPMRTRDMPCDMHGLPRGEFIVCAKMQQAPV